MYVIRFYSAINDFVPHRDYCTYIVEHVRTNPTAFRQKKIFNFFFSSIHKWHKEQIGKVFPSKSFLILVCRSQQAQNIIPGERRVSTIRKWMYLNRPISIDLVWSYIFSPIKEKRTNELLFSFSFFGDSFYKSSAIYQKR